MSHCLIAGSTESGKTTLARILAGEYRRRGKTVLVLDPVHAEWGASFQTHRAGDFITAVKSCRDSMIFVDESAKAMGEYRDEIEWLATTSRHLGHCSHFVVHRVRQLSPTVREQCRRLFLFTHSRTEAAIVQEEYYAPEIDKMGRLPQFHFLLISRFDTPRRGIVDVVNRTVKIS